ncbi:MAG: hypothetical protein ACJAXA_002314 [Candidatus Aldehydirespiratoraceae bacterium]|jgi:hypothetical protein
MITLCHAAKGGSGTTVVACTRAVGSPGPSLLVDFEGDAPAMLGLPEPDRPGVVDWLASNAPIAHLDDLLIDVTPSTFLLPARMIATSPGAPNDLTDQSDRWDDLIDWLNEWCHDTGGSIVVDGGTSPLPPSFVEQCTNRWLVTRACYLSLRRAGRLRVPPTGVVLVEEPGRALSHHDVENSARAPIVATIAWDNRVARAIDCGLLLSGRLSRTVNRSLSKVAA